MHSDSSWHAKSVVPIKSRPCSLLDARESITCRDGGVCSLLFREDLSVHHLKGSSSVTRVKDNLRADRGLTTPPRVTPKDLSLERSERQYSISPVAGFWVLQRPNVPATDWVFCDRLTIGVRGSEGDSEGGGAAVEAIG
jgi:hypothetical protein